MPGLPDPRVCCCESVSVSMSEIKMRIKTKLEYPETLPSTLPTAAVTSAHWARTATDLLHRLPHRPSCASTTTTRCEGRGVLAR